MNDNETLAEFVARNPASKLTLDERHLLAAKTKQAIEDWSVVKYRDDFRWHLGASIIGGPCDRALWYTFHWASKDKRNGRMKRLHNRGHEEEKKLNAIFRGLGCTIYDVDPSTGKQWRVKYHNGHFGGSSDGALLLPKEWQISGVFIPEYKTSQTGETFNKLDKDGVEVAKEMHFVQQSIYGVYHGAKYGLYACVNKNDDDIYIEYTELSKSRASEAVHRAGNIITSDYIPAKISSKETFFQCQMCDHKEVCHSGVSMEINCRSCVYASPTYDAQWRCGKYGQDIPREYVPKACPEYKAIA